MQSLYIRWLYWVALASLAMASSCSKHDSDPNETPPIRGLKAFRVTDLTNAEVRRYPSVVQPAQESRLAFEVSGKLKALSLKVGQQVSKDELLAEIDPVSLKLRVQQADASLDEAQATLKNTESDYRRRLQLYNKNYATQSEIEDAANKLRSSQAQVEQARKQLDLAKEDLSKTKLLSPFDGIISSINVQDYAQIAPGQTILGVFREGAYEVSFTVPAAVVNRLSVDDTAGVSFADISDRMFSGHIKELGSRAERVSAFPVVVGLDESPPGLRAGMAAEVALSIRLSANSPGYLLPLSCFAATSQPLSSSPSRQISNKLSSYVFIYDASTSTVRKQAVEILGVRENMVIVRDGVNEGDIVAVAGVSYLHDGQQVRLLTPANEPASGSQLTEKSSGVEQ